MFNHGGSRMGGPRYGWGGVRGTPETGGEGTQWQTGRMRGLGSASPEAGRRRGEWQWRGHGPGASEGYGWVYQGGVSRGDATTLRTEAGMGDRAGMEARFAQERSGGLPRGRERYDPGRYFDHLGEGRGGQGGGGYARFGQDVRYDREYGASRGGMERPRGYDRGFGGGGRQGSGGMRGRDVNAELNHYGHGQAPAYNRFYGYDPEYQRARQRRYGADFRPRESF